MAADTRHEFVLFSCHGTFEGISSLHQVTSYTVVTVTFRIAWLGKTSFVKALGFIDGWWQRATLKAEQN